MFLSIVGSFLSILMIVPWLCILLLPFVLIFGIFFYSISQIPNQGQEVMIKISKKEVIYVRPRILTPLIPTNAIKKDLKTPLIYSNPRHKSTIFYKSKSHSRHQ